MWIRNKLLPPCGNAAWHVEPRHKGQDKTLHQRLWYTLTLDTHCVCVRVCRDAWVTKVTRPVSHSRPHEMNLKPAPPAKLNTCVPRCQTSPIIPYCVDYIAAHLVFCVQVCVCVCARLCICVLLVRVCVCVCLFVLYPVQAANVITMRKPLETNSPTFATPVSPHPLPHHPGNCWRSSTHNTHTHTHDHQNLIRRCSSPVFKNAKKKIINDK